MYTHWQWHVDRADHYEAINWNEIVMEAINPYNEDDDYYHSYPFEHVDRVNISDYGMSFEARHPCGLKFSWELENNDRDVAEVVVHSSTITFMNHLLTRLPDDHNVEVANYLYIIKRNYIDAAAQHRANLYKVCDYLDKLEKRMADAEVKK